MDDHTYFKHETSLVFLFKATKQRWKDTQHGEKLLEMNESDRYALLV